MDSSKGDIIVGANMSGLELRSKFMRRFTGLDRYSATIARAIVAGYLLQIVGAMVAGHFLLTNLATPLGYALVAALSIFIATRMRGLNNIVHECSHASFATDRQENVRLGSICASVVLSCYKDYRDEHLTHHRYLGDYDQDLDLQGIEDLKLHDPLTMRTVLRHIFTPLVGRHLPYYLGANMSARDGWPYQVLKISLIVGTLFVAVMAPVTAIAMIIIPFVFIYSAMNYWTDCLDHAGLVSSEDDIDSSRNILAPTPLKLLLFPRNDCFHLVHHLFPQIPAKHLPACHEVLETDTTYAMKPHAVRGAKNAPKGHKIMHPAE